MMQGLRSAIVAAILAIVMLSWAAVPARAELAPDLLADVEAALQQETDDALAQALLAVLDQNGALATEIAVAAVLIRPELSGLIAFLAASAAPDQALEIANAIVDVEPLYAGDVIAGITEALPELGEQLAAVVTGAIEPPAPALYVPITPVTGTAENPGTAAASPTN